MCSTQWFLCPMAARSKLLVTGVGLKHVGVGRNRTHGRTARTSIRSSGTYKKSHIPVFACSGELSFVEQCRTRDAVGIGKTDMHCVSFCTA